MAAINWIEARLHTRRAGILSVWLPVWKEVHPLSIAGIRGRSR